MFELTPFVRRRNLQSYDPFKDFFDFGNDFFNFGNEYFKNAELANFKTDIKDIGSSYEIEADLPGFNKEDINIDVDDNYLTINAQRHFENDEKDEKGNYIRRERSYGSFKRSFDLTGINAEDIHAEYTNGVLKLNLPKQEEPETPKKRIEIQ